MSDIVGAVASSLIFLSFIPKNIKMIRWLNLIGSILFVWYSIMVGATWTLITNIGLIFVQIIHIFILTKKENQ